MSARSNRADLGSFSGSEGENRLQPVEGPGDPVRAAAAVGGG